MSLDPEAIASEEVKINKDDIFFSGRNWPQNVHSIGTVSGGPMAGHLSLSGGPMAWPLVTE